jgi:hypothetical protein
MFEDRELREGVKRRYVLKQSSERRNETPTA